MIRITSFPERKSTIHNLKIPAPLLMMGSGAAMASDAPLWPCHCAISPDVRQAAFICKGDIHTVPVGGGRAVQFASHPAYNSGPVWSPDSKRIACTSDRLGGMVVLIVPAERAAGRPG